MILSSKLYDKLKFLVQVVMPAFGAMYFALAAIWGLPAAEQVLGTIAAVSTFAGVTLQISSSNYKKSESVIVAGDKVVLAGDMVVTEMEGKRRWSLELDEAAIDAMFEAEELRFKVKR